MKRLDAIPRVSNKPKEQNKPDIHWIPTLTIALMLLAVRPLYSTAAEPWIGLVYSAQTVTVSAQIEAEVIETLVKLGDVVAPGDVMVRLNLPGLIEEQERADAEVRIAKANVAEAELRLRLKESEYDRRRAAGQSISAEQLNIAKGEYETAQTQTVSSRARLSAALADRDLLAVKQRQTEITAPLGGIIGASSVQVGSLIASGERVLEIVNPDDLLVRFAIPGHGPSSVQPGQPVFLEYDSGQISRAIVSAVAPGVDPVTRFRIAEAQLTEAKADSLGQGVKVSLPEPRNSHLASETP